MLSHISLAKYLDIWSVRFFAVIVGLCVILLEPSHATSTRKIDAKTIITYMEKRLTRDHVPGAAVAIVKDGEVALVHGFGQDYQGDAIDAKTRFLLGSMSKSFTALAVMRLIESGTLSLDMQVAQHLVELHKAPEIWQTVTLEHLLTHTSGLPSKTGGPPTGAPLAAYIAALKQVEFVANPGERHIYASANYLLIARLIEAVTGLSYETVLQQQVLTPLSIDPQNNNQSGQKLAPFAGGHQYWFVWPKASESPADPGRLATATLSASISDMARFLIFQLGDGTIQSKRLLPREELAAMHSGKVDGDGFRYGYGWRESKLGSMTAVHHGGILPNYRGKMVLLPEHNAGVVVLTNASSLLPFSIRPTSHRLADEIAIHLAGGNLGQPRLGFWTWLLLYWGGLGGIFLHQAVTLIRLATGHERARRPGLSAIADIFALLLVLFATPFLIGIGWQDMAIQTLDLVLWLASMSVMWCLAAFIRLRRLYKNRDASYV